MVTVSKYKCEDCGYEVIASKYGYFLIKDHGECYLFKCTTCKQIVPILATSGSERLQMPFCPHCGVGTDEPLYTWNPVEGRCPKCEGKMKEDSVLHSYQQ